jgi:hypothetical protein
MILFADDIFNFFNLYLEFIKNLYKFQSNTLLEKGIPNRGNDALYG